MTSLSQTHATLRGIAQHAPANRTRVRALLLDQLLTHAPTPLSPGMLRQVVIAIRDLAGPAWLAAHASDPAVSAFTALDTTPAPPPLTVLDHILAHCLQARFTPAAPADPSPGPGTATRQHRQPAA